jgi:DNA polymerase III subunit gamma/tau
MVYYLKYRPRKISELDSIAIQERLSAVLKGKLPDNIPHAFLFTGPKGLGKTSTARIVAKAINCTNRKKQDIEPCNKCVSCKGIDSGASLDVLEIDGASNRGIDEIRELREKIRLSPVNSLKKVYIIDEVHMLTTEAFNALLKTLEEPPIHAEFILCTTEPHKVPDTISSRCFHLRFTRATEEDLVSSFKRIIKGEGLEADKEALLQVAALSDGSFRDGAKILEEVATGSKKITVKTVEKKYSFKNINKVTEELISALRKKDAKTSIQLISKLSDENTDFKYFSEKLINSLHTKLIEDLENGLGEAEKIKELISLLINSYSEIKYSVLPQLPLELAVIEWCTQVKLDIKNEKSYVDKFDTSNKKSFVSEIKLSNDSKPDIPIISKGKNDNILEELIEKIGKENFSIAGVLRGCSVESFKNGSITLSTEYKFHKERLSDKKVISMLEENMKEIIGNDVKVSIILKS